MTDLKRILRDRCAVYVAERIANAQNAISDAKDAAESDEKSSAGDKYETTREMMQQEIARNQQQLLEARKIELLLNQLPTGKTAIAGPGALVITNQGAYFLAIGAGQVELDGMICHTIATTSPLGRAFAGKQAGDEVVLNTRTYLIREVL